MASSVLPATMGTYHQMYHQIYAYGNISNYGNIILTNETQPVYNAFTAIGAASLYLKNATDNNFDIYGQTDLYNLIIDKGIDTGDILLFEEISIEPGDTVLDLRNKSAICNFKLFLEAINRISEGNILIKKQLPNEGKQYFVMHPRIKEIIDSRLELLKLS